MQLFLKWGWYLCFLLCKQLFFNKPNQCPVNLTLYCSLVFADVHFFVAKQHQTHFSVAIPDRHKIQFLYIGRLFWKYIQILHVGARWLKYRNTARLNPRLCHQCNFNIGCNRINIWSSKLKMQQFSTDCSIWEKEWSCYAHGPCSSERLSFSRHRVYYSNPANSIRYSFPHNYFPATSRACKAILHVKHSFLSAIRRHIALLSKFGS